VNNLETRIRAAKQFLNTEATQVRLGNATSSLDLQEIGYQMDVIHEIEQTGLRNISEVQEIKLNRVLGKLESVMQIKISHN
jgi:hypothetical protein